MKWILPVGIVLSLLSLAPLGSVLLAEWLGNLHGCDVHEGFANPCVFWGADRGETLASMFVAGWYMLFTAPFALLGCGMIVAGLGLRASARRENTSD